MNIRNLYKPLYLSELEEEYPLFIDYLNSNKTFIVNGTKGCGKSTITKLYLQKLNYDYLLIDDFSLTKDNIIEKIKFRTNSVFSYFYNQKYIVVIDNFDLFDNSVRDYIINNSSKSQYIIITQKYLNFKINYIRINPYTTNYILNLYCNIYFLEKGYNCNDIPRVNNISQMFSILEFNLTTHVCDTIINNSNESNVSNESNNYKFFFDKFDFNLNDIIREKNFIKKLYIIDKINSYGIFHNNIIYNYNSIDDLADSYEYLSCSLLFLHNININMEYYSILSIIGTSQKLKDFKIYKEHFQIRKKNNLKYY